MKFRATLHGVPQGERPIVEFSNFRESIDAAAKRMIARKPDTAYVTIEESVWTEVGRVGTV